MNDDPNPAATAAAAAGRVPKYKAPDFMRKEMALFFQTRMETRLIRRNGDSDTPILAVSPVAAVRAPRPIRPIFGVDVD